MQGTHAYVYFCPRESNAFNLILLYRGATSSFYRIILITVLRFMGSDKTKIQCKRGYAGEYPARGSASCERACLAKYLHLASERKIVILIM